MCQTRLKLSRKVNECKPLPWTMGTATYSAGPRAVALKGSAPPLLTALQSRGHRAIPRHVMSFKLSVGRTGPFYFLEIEGVFTQGSRRCWSGYLVGRIFALDGSDWSKALRYHSIDTKPDTDFKSNKDRGSYMWRERGHLLV